MNNIFKRISSDNESHGRREQAQSGIPERRTWEIKRKCDRSWCRRCYKAYTLFISLYWDQQGGIEGLIKSATDPDGRKTKRASKSQNRLDALADVGICFWSLIGHPRFICLRERMLHQAVSNASWPWSDAIPSATLAGYAVPIRRAD